MSVPARNRLPGRVELVAVFCGGALGVLFRVGLGELVAVAPGAWPWATQSVNVAGAGLLGALVAWSASDRAPRGAWRAAIGPGFCGGLTTFSALQVELLTMLDHGDALRAGLYALTTVALGYAAVLAGGALARRGAAA